jgi:hypothetical protein
MYHIKNTLVLHKFGKKTRIDNTLKNTLFQLSLIPVINYNKTGNRTPRHYKFKNYKSFKILS